MCWRWTGRGSHAAYHPGIEGCRQPCTLSDGWPFQGPDYPGGQGARIIRRGDYHDRRRFLRRERRGYRGYGEILRAGARRQGVCHRSSHHDEILEPHRPEAQHSLRGQPEHHHGRRYGYVRCLPTDHWRQDEVRMYRRSRVRWRLGRLGRNVQAHGYLQARGAGRTSPL